MLDGVRLAMNALSKNRQSARWPFSIQGCVAQRGLVMVTDRAPPRSRRRRGPMLRRRRGLRSVLARTRSTPGALDGAVGDDE